MMSLREETAREWMGLAGVAELAATEIRGGFPSTWGKRTSRPIFHPLVAKAAASR